MRLRLPLAIEQRPPVVEQDVRRRAVVGAPGVSLEGSEEENSGATMALDPFWKNRSAAAFPTVVDSGPGRNDTVFYQRRKNCPRVPPVRNHFADPLVADILAPCCCRCRCDVSFSLPIIRTRMSSS
ncbi:hypothetical protein PanWU01x14_061010 [Parasponia andersonii]|uniref:Uncharacterized protein n=1 Tax=Parasponia andersonii TaxID=3476 RepID=A0A2P5DI42_PARAD|nr:hypothetical protein PanWU01x14_061010 [Parasponia andersonii]